MTTSSRPAEDAALDEGSTPPQAPPASADGDGSGNKRRGFPTAVTVLGVVAVGVWIATLFIPAGRYATDADGSLIAGSYQRVDSTLSFGDRVAQLLLSPINGAYGIIDNGGIVDTENAGRMFGSIGVVLFILALGAFISVSFSTRALEVAVASLGKRLGNRGWILIAVIMVLFSLLGSTMGFSVETFGFYALLLPLMSAIGYDRMTAVGTIVLGALVGSMASTVNPFSIGVASGEAEVSIGDGIGLRVVIWTVLTALAVLFVIRYANRVRRDPSKSIGGFWSPAHDDDGAAGPSAEVATKTSATQRWVLAITAFVFLLMIFSVIPWSAIFGATTGAADDLDHEVAGANPFWFQLDWWFPQLAMLFILGAIVVGVVARMGEKKLVGLIQQGMADMIGPAIVIVLARGVAVIMNNTETLDTVLHAMEQIVTGTSAAVFTTIVALVNMPLAFLIPSSSGHATLAMPLLAPLSDFAGVQRALTITAFQMGHGLMLLFSPTNVVVIGGLAIAGVGYNKYLRFVWPFLLIALVLVLLIVGIAAAVS
ncbi:YfcC family protein [Microbacterium protaetiae]|uniref:YfcC family protein n=1 Tax=Microbacterium protaetiae TaxID=2509458 RepID=A0A4V0YDA6_9MICO|nr:YfcC family protein [Microbacterium protaetiae]QAY60041.1 YfcC family protein [Microbacterium protaetiae]